MEHASLHLMNPSNISILSYMFLQLDVCACHHGKGEKNFHQSESVVLPFIPVSLLNKLAALKSTATSTGASKRSCFHPVPVCTLSGNILFYGLC